MDKTIKKKVSLKEKSKSFYGFFQSIIDQSKEGIRLHPKTGKPINKSTVKTYVTTYKHLTEFQVTRKKEGFIEFNSWQAIGNGADPSFLNNRTAMAYIIETANGHYVPARFNICSELEVKYEHQNASQSQ
ncbi:MAG: hypothetical protein ACXWWC_08030 [Chitinophagaceae bacterium]